MIFNRDFWIKLCSKITQVWNLWISYISGMVMIETVFLQCIFVKLWFLILQVQIRYFIMG